MKINTNATYLFYHKGYGKALYFFISLLFTVLRIQFFGTIRANAMGELRFGVVSYVSLYLFPVPLIIADLLAGGANRQHALHGPDFRECILQFNNKPLPVLFCPLSGGDVADCHA